MSVTGSNADYRGMIKPSEQAKVLSYILKSFNVTALPVFILFKDGKQVWRKDGIVTEQEIAGNLN